MPPAKKTTRRRATKKAAVTKVEVLDGDRYAVYWTDAKGNEHSELLTIPFTEELIAGSDPRATAHYQMLLDAINVQNEKE